MSIIIQGNQNTDNLNPTDSPDIRYSKNVDIDDFNESEYNIVNTTGKKGYAELKREVMTWDDIKYPNEIRCIELASRGFYIYKMLDNDTRDIIVYNPKNAYGRRQNKLIRKVYNSRAFNASVSVLRLIEYYRNSRIDNGKLSGDESRKPGNDADVNVETLRQEGNNNTRGVIENDNNDNLQEGRRSLSVDESYAFMSETERELNTYRFDDFIFKNIIGNGGREKEKMIFVK